MVAAYPWGTLKTHSLMKFCEACAVAASQSEAVAYSSGEEKQLRFASATQVWLSRAQHAHLLTFFYCFLTTLL
jgi:hypothetical protein